MDRPQDYAPDGFPTFVWIHGPGGRNIFYGFPVLPGAEPAAIKVATEEYAHSVNPDHTDWNVSGQESETIYAHRVAGRLRGIRPSRLRAEACLYTVTPDAGFLVDVLADQPNVLAASACCGHGFKHSVALGEPLADKAAASGPWEADSFGVARFGAGRAV